MKNFFFGIIFIILRLTHLGMYKASVNANCTSSSTVHMQAYEYENGNKGLIFFFLLQLALRFPI